MASTNQATSDSSDPMKTKILAALFALSLLALGTCITKLKHDLGEFQYIGRVPVLKIKVLAGEWVPAKESYDHPHYRFRGVITQIGSFPVKRYGVNARLKLKIPRLQDHDGFVSTDVIDGSGAFDLDTTFYDLQQPPDIGDPVIEFTTFSWGPSRTPPVDFEDLRKK